MNISYKYLKICIYVLLATIVEIQGDTDSLPRSLSVYIDSVSHKIYWPMDLPFWVRLATSPDPKSPTFLLDRYMEKSDQNRDVQLESGIKLEIPGRQFIRWVNHLTEEETSLRFFADGHPPVLRDSLFGAPEYVAGTDTFYGKDLHYLVIAHDELSGVKDIFSAIGPGKFFRSEYSLSFKAENEWRVRSYAVDNVGYISPVKTVRFIVDTTPPVSTHAIETNFIKTVLSKSSTFKLTSLDKHSGVRARYYKFDNQTDYKRYNDQPIALTALDDGKHSLNYYAVDNVSNTEQIVEFPFYLDTIAPVPGIAIEGDIYLDGSVSYVSPRSLVTLTATDNNTGVEKIFYRFGGSKTFSVYGTPILLNPKNGPFSVTYSSTDKLGNTSSDFTKNYFMDITPPRTNYKINGPCYQQRTAIWATSETTLELFAEDNSSGVRHIKYQIGSNLAVTYEKPIKIDIEGKYVTRFRGIDNVNNSESDNVILIIIDNSEPEIREIFSVAPIDTVVNTRGETVSVYPQYTSLFLAATDQSAGIKNVWYSLNGAKLQEYQNVILCDKPDEYAVLIRVQDNVGHEAEKTVSFFVKSIEAGK